MTCSLICSASGELLSTWLNPTPKKESRAVAFVTFGATIPRFLSTKTIILYFKHAVIIPSTLSSSSVWLSPAPRPAFYPFTQFGLPLKYKALRPPKNFLRTQEKRAELIPSPTLVVSIRMAPVKDPSHRALYCRAKDESSALLPCLVRQTRLRRASSWPVRPTWRNLPSDAQRGRPEPYGSEPRQPEPSQTSAWNRTGRFRGRQR